LFIDANQPTVVPPPTLIADGIPDEPPAQVQKSASITSHAPVIGAEKTKAKAKKASERDCKQTAGIYTNNCGRE
jgi:hypothetical protein